MFLSRPYHAPTDDGGILIEPRLDQVNQLFQFQTQSKTTIRVPISEFRAEARREVLELAAKYRQQFDEAISVVDSDRWIVAGHQPELFHPGVWLKNFVLARLGRDHHAVTLNLIVDNDEVKTNTVRVPNADGNVASIPFDDPIHGIAFEKWCIRNEELFRSFPDRLAEVTTNWNDKSLAPQYWKKTLQHVHRTQIGDRLAPARRHFEHQWGAQNLELPVSWLCKTKAFAQFVEWIINDLPRFRSCYNDVVHEYRAAHGIRSRNHPVSDLAENETPFWTWTENAPKRMQLFLSSQRPAIIRPRALTLTMFTRMALSDVFVHGIGGAKYDELTDAIAERFFGIKLTPFMVVSGTLRLPFETIAPADVQQLQQQQRQLLWNPQRSMAAAAPDLTAERLNLLSLPTEHHIQRRRKARQLRNNLDRWRPITSQAVAAIDHEIDQSRKQQQVNAILQSREYPFILFPEERLKFWFQSATSA